MTKHSKLVGLALFSLVLAGSLLAACGDSTNTAASVPASAATTAARAGSAAMTEGTMMKPTEGAMVAKTTEAAMIKPTEAAMMKPTEAAMMKPTEGAMVAKTTEATMMKPTEAAMIKPTEAAMIKPTEAVMAKTTEAATMKPTEAVMAKTTEAVMAKTTEAAMMPPARLVGNFNNQGAEPVAGKAILGKTADGKTILRFEGLKSAPGPDLYVYLTKETSPAGDKQVKAGLEIGKLRAVQGDLNYELNAGLDLNQYKSVAIYCRSFSVVFGYANLTNEVS